VATSKRRCRFLATILTALQVSDHNSPHLHSITFGTAKACADFQFIRPLYHPNIYANGKLCISILHPPGEDAMSGELASERWSPAQRVESVLLSIVSLLDDAEVSSPANVDAGVMLRKNPEEFKSLVKKDVETSRQDIPKGFVMPETHMPPPEKMPVEDKNFWYDSDADDDFGGSETDAEVVDEEDEDGEDQEHAEEMEDEE